MPAMTQFPAHSFVPRPAPLDRAGRLVAHRGASAVAPENTLAAISAAAAAGAGWVEFDVCLLGDGTAVVHHDPTLERCTDWRGPLAALSAADLAGIDAGAWFGAAFRGEPLPTLEAVLDRLEAEGLGANLEIKVHDREPSEVAGRVAEALTARPWTPAGIVVSSFTGDALRSLRARLPDQRLAILHHDPPADWPAELAVLGAEALHMNHRYLTAAHVDAAQAARAELRVFTCNFPERLVAFRGQGLTGVITDDPARYLADPDWAAWIGATVPARAP